MRGPAQRGAARWRRWPSRHPAPGRAARGNGTLLVEVPNRGRKISRRSCSNDAPAGRNTALGRDRPGQRLPDAAGLYPGLDRLAGGYPGGARGCALAAPVVPGVTGPCARGIPLRPHAQPGDRAADLPGRPRPRARRVTVRARLGRAAPDAGRASASASSTRRASRSPGPAGFDAGALYELIYTAKRPGGAGLGFAATARRRRLPAPRDGAGQSARRRAARPGAARDRLRRLAVRPLPARLPLSRLQRGPGRRRRVRRADAACRRHAADVRPMSASPSPAATRGTRRTRPGRPTRSPSPTQTLATASAAGRDGLLQRCR